MNPITTMEPITVTTMATMMTTKKPVNVSYFIVEIRMVIIQTIVFILIDMF